MALTYQAKWFFGDDSGDGHCQTETHTFVSNLPAAEVWRAYLVTCNELGWGFHELHSSITHTHKPIFVDYEDRQIPLQFLNALIKEGFEAEKIFDYEYGLESKSLEVERNAEGKVTKVVSAKTPVWCSCDDLFEIVMWYVKRARPDFEYAAIEIETVNQLQMGYGLLGG